MSINFVARRNELQDLMLQLGREIPPVMGAFASLHKASIAKGALDGKLRS